MVSGEAVAVSGEFLIICSVRTLTNKPHNPANKPVKSNSQAHPTGLTPNAVELYNMNSNIVQYSLIRQIGKVMSLLIGTLHIEVMLLLWMECL